MGSSVYAFPKEFPSAAKTALGASRPRRAQAEPSSQSTAQERSTCPCPQAIGRSRGGRTTKIHAIVDARGRPIAIEVTPGHLGDIRVATALISGVPWGRCLAGDAAYDSVGLRRFLIERGMVPVIPNNPTQETSSFRRSPTQSHRAHVLPPQGLETHRNPL
jgi:Transposase DDE domain